MMRRRNSRFCFMVAGAKSSGKSSLFNSLVKKEIVKIHDLEELNIYMLSLDCDGTQQLITFIDTPGFGASLNDDVLQDSLVNYIKEQFDMLIEEETKIRRNPKYEDSRVHCLIYLISATGNGLTQRDIVFLKKVSGLVNIIPVISKADGLTIEETSKLKELIRDQLYFFKIKTFDFENEDYLTPRFKDWHLNSNVPFTIISSHADGGCSKVRESLAGSITINSRDMCDLSLFREILLASHLEALVDVTSNDIYEQYRADVLELAMNK